MYNETAGAYTQSAGKISGGYLISVDREHFFRFGLSLGAGNNTLNFGELDVVNDPAINNLVENRSFLIGDFGVAYHFGHFNVGFSLPSLFSQEVFTDESGFQVKPAPQDNMLFKINYRGHLSDDIAIEPHLLYRYNKFLPNQYEATVIIHLLHIVWVGGTYRQDAGFVGLLGAKLKEKIGIGYSYEYGNPNNAGLLGPTHEIHVGYHLGTKKEHAEHVSSFIKSHRKSAEARAREEELERQRKLAELKKSRQTTTSTTTEASDDDALGLVASAPKKEPEVPHNWNYEKESDPIQRVNKYGETERGIKFDRINEDGEKEVVFSWLPPPPPGANEELYEIANPNEEPLIRTKPDGTKEAGIKWKRTIDGGEPETLIIWNEILTEEEANELDHNPAEAHVLGDAKIRITREESVPEEVVDQPIDETESEPVEFVEESEPEPEQEPVIQEQEEVIQPTEEEEIAKGDPELTDDFRSNEEIAGSDEHLEVKRGNHMLELPSGHYVVAGVFESFQNAEDQSDVLFERGFHDTKVGYLSARGYYYVVIFQSDSMQQANRERNRIKKLSGLSKVWVLKVND